MKASVLIVAGAITASVIIYVVRWEQLANDANGEPFPQSIAPLPPRSAFAAPLDATGAAETNQPNSEP